MLWIILKDVGISNKIFINNIRRFDVLYIGFIYDRRSLGFMCVKDIEAGRQVTGILKTVKTGGICICIAITIAVNSRSSLFINYQVDHDLSKPSHERLIASSSNQKIQKTNINILAELKVQPLPVYNPYVSRVKTGSGAMIEIQNHQNQTPEALKSALVIRSGDLGKSGPGARAKADAKANASRTGSSILPGADGYVPSQGYCLYHGNQPRSCKPIVKGGILAYLRRGHKLPSLDLTRAYQNTIKNFCEDRTQSYRDDKSTFKGKPSITFVNEKTRQVVVFDRETKIFITAYKLSEDQITTYQKNRTIGIN